MLTSEIRAAIMLLPTMFLSVGAQAQPADGGRLFRQRCGACHSVTEGQARPTGPNLFGLIGRDKGGATEFRTYSPAFRRLEGRWTVAELDRFLAAPGRYVPGTRMVIAVPDAGQRAAIVAYLASLRK